MVSDSLVIAGAAAMGAVVQETVYWYNIRHNLDEEKYRILIRSARYWVIVSAMIVVTAVVSLIWYSGDEDPGVRAAFAFGIGLPLLVKQLGQASSGSIKLGAKNLSYFRIS